MAVAGQVEHPERLSTLDISYRSEGTRLSAYLARPRESGSYPAIIICHDVFGLSDHARDVARRFANQGFVVLVPDGFARLDLSPDESKIRGRGGLLEDRLTVADLNQGADLLRALPYCSGKVGCVGFCMGGRNALLWACSSPKVDAAIDCWGGFVTGDNSPLHPTPVVDLVGQLKIPVYAVFGGDDQNPSPAHSAELRQKLEKAGKLGLVTMETFAGCGHAFFADHRPEMYREKAAFELWPKMVAFFKQHLK
jgi:carboxymethylenebutenolidase